MLGLRRFGIRLEAARFEKIRSERSVKRSEGDVLNPRRAFERGARDLK